MPTNKKMLTALRKLLYSEKDLSETYQIERKMVNMIHPVGPKSLYRMWDHKVQLGDHEIPVRLFMPKNQGAHPIMIFFHGGGFVTGNIDSYSKVCKRMANITGHIVLSVDYRLAPEHPFPAGLEDCYAVVKDVVELNKKFNKPLKSITLIGDSAGGNLAAAVSLLARDRGDFKVDRQILLYPATNTDHSDKAPYASIKENGEDQPTTFVVSVAGPLRPRPPPAYRSRLRFLSVAPCRSASSSALPPPASQPIMLFFVVLAP